jgi:pyruvate carboxylase
MTGLVTLAVQAGTTVQAGTPVAMIEAMKMESTLTAPLTGTEREWCCDGTRVEQRDLILVIAPNADERAKIAALS